MLFTFGLENTFNSPVEPSFVLDMTREQLLLNKSFINVKHWADPKTTQRVEGNYDVVGQVGFEVTLGNEAWGRLFEVLLGGRVRLTDKAFSRSREGPHLIIGQLSASLAAGAASFTITEKVTGEFDGTNHLIIGDEFITDCVISNGSVTGANRGQGGTEDKSHDEKDNVYLITNQIDRDIDICSPQRDTNGRVFFDKSLSGYILRNNNYFLYSGLRIDQFEVNFAPENVVDCNVSFTGADGTNYTPPNVLTTFDDNPLIIGHEVAVLSSLIMLDMRRLYINLNNTLVKNLWGWNHIRVDLPVKFQNVYGQLTWVETDILHYEDYINNERHNLSIQLIGHDERPLEKAIIFNSNDMRINTLAPQMTGGLVIQDSAPFYTYGQSEIYLQY